ncbi:hypothetical protein CONCODRAFT_9510 [Conidiobolus coronatus NRRL 28638]|uniref:RNI-like protein n=1 Tax=Conidiobolus coronatus (strain ATCC 28846 / CBS 209.66 / NRRL 28638) TaxID=796925 RepID=A0A137NZL4_CONC2|nr:hypothetical protein CONCODRAFT_9510 [Conidiobolus coronatus NRRL 28638]|eukprot:KXN68280.1 hypothetical protein CONCODRAFT_9510 [Conidiobolus coronatus NRRL 28638]
MKSDLGPKLELVQSIDLDCEKSKAFAETFVKLLPNIKTLRFDGSWDCGCGCEGEWQQGLITVLSCMDHLEHVEIEFECELSEDIGTKNQIFPKSLKSLDIRFNNTFEQIEDENIYFYDTIDSSYINLQSITIFSNRMLQNLSSGLPNLQKVEIIDFQDLDESKLIKFLKTNPQLRKMNTTSSSYNEEIINTVLSSENLEYWHICSYGWMGTEVNNLPSNYSIKHLRISYDVPAPIALKIINACKSIKTLDLSCYEYHLNSLEWSKFERRINILNLPYDIHTPNHIKDIDALRLFKSIYIERKYDLGDLIIRIFFEQMNSIKLNNYNITITTKSFILELINKTN